MLSGALGFGASALDLAGTLYSNNANNAMSGKQMRFADSQSRQVREWQERLSNTAYQRAVADMKAAGLNPMLMASKGFQPSTTPAGSTGSTPSAIANQPLKSNLASAIGLYSQLKLNEAQIKVLDSQSAKNIADARKTGAETGQKETEGQVWRDIGNLYQVGRDALLNFNKTNPFQTSPERSSAKGLLNYFTGGK